MKRVFSLAIVLALLLCACAGGGETPAGDQTDSPNEPASLGEQKSLREHGMDVIALMDEMANNDSFLTLYGVSEIAAVTETITSGDYSVPKKVYELTIPSMQEMLALFGSFDGDSLTDGLTEPLLEYLEHKAPSIIINEFNSSEGSAKLAAASVLSANKLFVSSELTGDVIYIYTFQDGYPVAVVFTTGEDGAVNATGTFVLSDSFSVETLEMIQNLSEGMITIQEVED